MRKAIAFLLYIFFLISNASSEGKFFFPDTSTFIAPVKSRDDSIISGLYSTPSAQNKKLSDSYQSIEKIHDTVLLEYKNQSTFNSFVKKRRQLQEKYNDAKRTDSPYYDEHKMKVAQNELMEWEKAHPMESKILLNSEWINSKNEGLRWAGIVQILFGTIGTFITISDAGSEYSFKYNESTGSGKTITVKNSWNKTHTLYLLLSLSAVSTGIFTFTF